MSTKRKLVVLVSTLAGGQDVVCGDDLNIGQDIQRCGDVGTALDLGNERQTLLLSDTNSRDIVSSGRGGGPRVAETLPATLL